MRVAPGPAVAHVTRIPVAVQAAVEDWCRILSLLLNHGRDSSVWKAILSLKSDPDGHSICDADTSPAGAAGPVVYAQGRVGRHVRH